MVSKKRVQLGKFTPRQVYDFRLLNEIIKKDTYSMPMINNIINMIELGIKWISIINMYLGYFQIELTQWAIEKTVFITQDRQWEYLRMPFRLYNTSAIF